MQKNIKEIMIALNQVLTTTVWVNADRQIVSLADELKIGHNNAPRSKGMSLNVVRTPVEYTRSP